MRPHGSPAALERRRLGALDCWKRACHRMSWPSDWAWTDDRSEAGSEAAESKAARASKPGQLPADLRSSLPSSGVSGFDGSFRVLRLGVSHRPVEVSADCP